MKKVLILHLLIFICLPACKKVSLDQLAFPSEKLTKYDFEKYDDPEIIIPPNYLPNPLEQYLIKIPSIDNESGEVYNIYGLYMGDTTNISTDTIIYFCHGQARHMDYYWTRQALLAHTGGLYNYGVFMIDYRGYGMSEGSSTEQGLIEDADAGIDWLISKGASGEKTVYYGFSLGAIPLIHRAAYRSDFIPSKLIIESPLASVDNITQSSTLLNTDSDFITSLDFNNVENIKEVEVPLMWLHGKEDSYVAISNGELIYDNYSGQYQEAWRIDSADHADVPLKMGLNNYISAFLTFIRK
ncbi:MAG: alpha/beta hydrolase [Crocinitomicaceae bacterium]